MTAGEHRNSQPTDLLGWLGFAAISIALFGADPIAAVSGVSFPRLLCLLAGLGLLLVGALADAGRRRAASPFLLWIAAGSVVGEALLVLRGFSPTGVNLWIGPCVAAGLYWMAPSLSVQGVGWLLAVSAALQGVEISTGSYLFVWRDASGGSALDENLFAGASGIMRAKGVFNGPLSAVGFALLAVALVPRRPWVVPVAFISSVLAQGRLGIFLTAILLISDLIARRKASTARASWLGWATGLGLVIATPVLLGEAGTTRLLNLIADPTADSNLGRAYYWQLALQELAGYTDAVSLMLGRPGGFRSVAGNSAESSLLQLALDGGLVGVAVYGTAIILALHAARRSDATRPVAILVVITALGVFPLVDSLQLNVVFWLMCFHTYLSPRTIQAERPSLVVS